ncbi:MAG: UPF0182 family protein, partial [Candidatus Poribacteria bacterium]|nr:UPF0182 family protein [Candidatus Poribacteria bacterium]
MDSRFKRLIVLVAILAAIGGIVAILVQIYPDLLWFGVVGYSSVYKKILITKVLLGIGVGGFFLAVTLINVYLLYRFTPSRLSPTVMESIPIRGEADFDLRRLIYGVLTLLAIGFSVLMGYAATDRWEPFLRYSNAEGLTFQNATPVIDSSGRDASELHIAELELKAKGLQVGDDVTIQGTDGNVTSSIQSIQVQDDGIARIQLENPVGFDVTTETTLMAAARDPVFHKDVSYYVFRMPLERFIIGNLFGLFMLLTFFSAGIYFFHGLLIGDNNRLSPPAHVKVHLLILGALTLIFRAWNYRFAMYDLLYTSNDVVRGGGGYAAIHARLPLLNILLVLSAICAAVFLISIFLKRLRYALATFGIFLVVGMIGQIYPAVVQKWRVEPNKQELETEYINYNIKATLHSYDLEENTVTEEEYPLKGELSYEGIRNRENAAVMNSVRLWDERPIQRTFRQLQELRSQYDFHGVDIDRYSVEGSPRQVMLSVRELNINELPHAVRNDWFKRTYVYTHGYGAVMSPVNEILDGKPKMYVRDIDPVHYEPEWSYRFGENPGPRIYYGERTNHYVIVHPARSEDLEFDYPTSFGEDFAKYSYLGQGGVELSSFWRKFVYMLKFGNEFKFVLPGEINSDSRVLYHRNIKERVKKIAPFLQYDGDPYAIVHDGRLVWMLDAYTTTHRYPYAAPMQHALRAEIAERRGSRVASRIQGGEKPWGNYIRNAVKVVVDAYDGSVEFYVIEQEKDPIVECYRSIFPDLFKPFDMMPEELKRHIRYPTTIFLIQARMYQDYHMKDPVTFYASEDQWEIGKELYDNTERQRALQAAQLPSSPFAPRQPNLPETVTNVQEVAPYYVIIKLPGEERAEFMLMLPFTPKNKPNLTAWFAARCDLPQYGQLLVFRFPKGKLAPGPMQVENFISQEPEISQQISLWDSQGSRVLRGNLLIIPMNESILYVEPIYIQSEDAKTAIPELRRVVIGYKENVAWGKSLDEALINMFGKSLASATGVSVTSGSEPD